MAALLSSATKTGVHTHDRKGRRIMARLALCGLVAFNLFSVECRCSVLFIGVESICQLGQFLVLQEDIYLCTTFMVCGFKCQKDCRQQALACRAQLLCSCISSLIWRRTVGGKLYQPVIHCQIVVPGCLSPKEQWSSNKEMCPKPGVHNTKVEQPNLK